MKKILMYLLPLGVVFNSIYAIASFAEERWYLQSGTISIPFRFYQYVYNPNFPGDSGGESNGIVSFPLSPTIPENTISSSNSVIIIESQPYYPRIGMVLQRISFTLDTFEKKLKGFSLYSFSNIYRNGGSGSYYLNWRDSLSFSYLDYSIGDDSSIIVNVKGAKCLANLDTAYEYFHDEGWEANKSGSSILTGKQVTYTKYLLPDTASYTCSIKLQRTSLSSGIKKSSSLQNFFVSSSLPDHTINFTLPSSTHPESLFIYDILGREAARLEIASGMTQYSMNSSRFPSGHYFARFGNSSSHFEVVQ